MREIRRWEDLTWQDFARLDAERSVAVLPVAAIEQHGPHLPLATDAMINRGILDRALALVADTPLLVLPIFPVGRSDEHAAFPGTLTLGAETLSRVWFEIGQSVHRAGLRKLVMVNSHGGQPQICDIVAQDLRVRFDMLAVVANTFAFGEPEGLFPEEERRHGVHAGASETSILLHLQPGSVRTLLVDDFRPASLAHEKRYRELRFHDHVTIGWATQDLHPLGACGDARLASATAGRAIIEHVAARLAVLLDEVSRYPLTNLKKGPLDADRAPPVRS
jgi:creatinine amidohydrolase